MIMVLNLSKFYIFIKVSLQQGWKLDIVQKFIPYVFFLALYGNN